MSVTGSVRGALKVVTDPGLGLVQRNSTRMAQIKAVAVKLNYE